MKLISKGILFILALMSLAAGLAKVFSMAQEVSLFVDAGIGVTPMLMLGILQVAGGVLAFIGRTRPVGLILIGIGFAASVLVVLMSGDLAFAAISTAPVLFCVGLLLLGRREQTNV